MNEIKKDFPLLDKITYLDSGAGALKPRRVIDAISEFYLKYPINPHSIESKLGEVVYSKIKETRELVANLTDASIDEVIFTSGTTESLNMFALMARDFLKEGDEIVVSKFNHIVNIVTWEEAAKATGAKLIYSETFIDDINDKTKVVAYAQQNNTLFKHIDIERLYKKVRKHGAVLVNDAAQAIVHEKVSLHDADVIAFSGNKLYGPTGIGVLIMRKELIAVVNQKKYGGGTISEYEVGSKILKEGLAAHEAGTPNTAGIIGLGAAIKWFNKYNEENKEKMIELAKYAYDALLKVPNIKIYSRRGEMNTIFTIEGVHSQDVVSYLGHKNIILRSGDHCAKLLKDVTTFKDSIRLSLGLYNDEKDIDICVKEIIDAKGVFLDVL